MARSQALRVTTPPTTNKTHEDVVPKGPYPPDLVLIVEKEVLQREHDGSDHEHERELENLGT